MAIDFVLVSCETSAAGTGEELLTAADLARATGLHPELVQTLYGIGLFDAEQPEDGEPRFSSGTIFRIRRAVRLREDLGLSWMSLGLVNDLLDRVDYLEARLRMLEAHAATEVELEAAA